VGSGSSSLKGQRRSGCQTGDCASTLLHLARIAHHHLPEGREKGLAIIVSEQPAVPRASGFGQF